MSNEFGRAEPDSACPVSLDLLGQLYRADEDSALDTLRAMSESRRIRLALFCYNRSHFRELALTIASSCDEGSLTEFAGVLGEVLASQSKAKVRKAEVAVAPVTRLRVKISLASTPRE